MESTFLDDGAASVGVIPFEPQVGWPFFVESAQCCIAIADPWGNFADVAANRIVCKLHEVKQHSPVRSNLAFLSEANSDFTGDSG